MCIFVSFFLQFAISVLPKRPRNSTCFKNKVLQELAPTGRCHRLSAYKLSDSPVMKAVCNWSCWPSLERGGDAGPGVTG